MSGARWEQMWEDCRGFGLKGFKAMKSLRAFGRGVEVNNLGFMLHSVHSDGAFMPLGTTRKDVL